MDICKWPQHTHYANWRVGQLSCPSNFGNGVVGCLWLYDLPDDISCLLTGFDYRTAKLLFLPTVLCWLTWLPWTKKGEMRTRLLTLVLIGPLSIRWTHSTSYICSELQQIASHFKRVISRQWHSRLETCLSRLFGSRWAKTEVVFTADSHADSVQYGTEWGRSIRLGKSRPSWMLG